jgi:hypothetical protein
MLSLWQERKKSTAEKCWHICPGILNLEDNLSLCKFKNVFNILSFSPAAQTIFKKKVIQR